MTLAYVDPAFRLWRKRLGYTGERAAEAAQAHGISLKVVKLADAKRGFVLLPRRWVIEMGPLQPENCALPQLYPPIYFRHTCDSTQ